MQQRQGRYSCLGILGAILVVWTGFFGCSDAKKPVVFYRKSSYGASDYIDLAEEFIG